MTSRICLVLTIVIGLAGFSPGAAAHPMGNFSISHYSRITPGLDEIAVRYILDFAEIPTLSEVQEMDRDSNGKIGEAEKTAYLKAKAPALARNLALKVDRQPLRLSTLQSSVELQEGAGGLKTMRLALDLTAPVPNGDNHEVEYLDGNYSARTGWKEIIVAPGNGVSLRESSARNRDISHELTQYPLDLAPPQETSARFKSGPGAATTIAAQTPVASLSAQTPRDLFTETITKKDLTPALILLGLIIAFVWGALHALSPGHGKTLVAAYLVGSRGTVRHAVFLGATVTITHTLGVFALGIATLAASKYVVPERLYPILTFISGALVLGIGVSLFAHRLKVLLGVEAHHHHHQHDHDGHDHVHSHGGHSHSHLPPGADGNAVTWKSLLALGISGGLLPCPSALIVLLASVALHRVAYGLLLVTAFSLGLAATLTGIGILFVYLGRALQAPKIRDSNVLKALPVLSALFVTVVGGVICWQALVSAGIQPLSLFSATEKDMGTASALSVLMLGLVFGLKHAVEADHLAAVTTIVSERKSLIGSAIVGGLWGLGHTISLLVAGVGVILLHIRVSERLAMGLEFCVAIMLVGLGINALRKLRKGALIHMHPHKHGGLTHVHLHAHESAAHQPNDPSHHNLKLTARPIIVGMIHGMAGSAALMLLVLSTIPSPSLGLVYIAVFGLGSIGGMMFMSTLVGLPARLLAGRFHKTDMIFRTLAGLFSLGFGAFMMYQIGYVDGLFR